MCSIMIEVDRFQRSTCRGTVEARVIHEKDWPETYDVRKDNFIYVL